LRRSFWTASGGGKESSSEERSTPQAQASEPEYEVKLKLIGVRNAKRSRKHLRKALPSPNHNPSGRRISPVNEQDKVWVRDKGQYAFVGPGGKLCNATRNLQIDHYPIPYARGGPNIARNLRLLCGKHNRFTAEEVYGKRHMPKCETHGQE
jgi:hypothetical protein